MKISRAVAAGAASVLLTTGLAACGGSDGGEAEGDEILIGGIAQYTGGYAATAGGVPVAWKAWVKAVNDKGGINGRDVKLIIKDTGGGDASAGLAAAKELIDTEGVVALLSFTQGDLTWIPYADTKGVPVINGILSAAPLKYSTAFPLGLTPSTLSYAYAEKVAEIGDSTAIYYPADIPDAKAVGDGEAVYGGDLGFEVKISQGISATLPDYTAMCQSIKDSKADSYQLFFPTDLLLNMTSQCFKLGVKAPQLLPAIVGPQQWSEDFLQGNPVVDVLAPFFDVSVPGIKEYRDAVQAYDPDFLGGPLDISTTAQAFAAVKMAEVAIGSIEGDVTTESVMAALYTIKDETLGGLTPPLTYTKGKPTRIHCWFVWDIKDGAGNTGADQSKPRCGPDDVLNKADDAILKAIS